MFKILIDTCVWIDLAKDHKQQPLLGVIEALIDYGEISLIVPGTIIEEFDRNKLRIVDDSRKSVTDVFNRVRESVHKFGDPQNKQIAIDQLNDVAHKIPILGEGAVDSIARIQKLLNEGQVIAITNDHKLKAAQRAIDGVAPYHRNKNSMNDAIIMEVYCSCIKEKPAGTRYSFVTHNTKDFSRPDGNLKEPHPDFENYFSKVRSLYFINLAEAIQKVRPEIVSDLMIDNEWKQEPRSFTEMLNAEGELIDKVWYNRHKNWLYKIKKGEHKIVKKGVDRKYKPNETPREIFNGAINAAKKVEQKYGKKNLGPWDDFEWGMINGKLSALRWVMGEDWDVFDT